MSDIPTAPPSSPFPLPPSQDFAPPGVPPYAALKQLKTIGILNIIAGCISFLWALLFCVEAALFASGFMAAHAPSAQPLPPGLPVMFFGLFLFGIVLAVIQLVGGIALLKHAPTARNWAVFAAVANFLAIIFWCCLPYYLIVGIYTLIVISRPHVKFFLPASPSRRPLSVTIIGVLAIVWAALTAFGLVVLVAQLTGYWQPDPQTASLYEDPAWHTWILSNCFLGIVIVPAWLFTGIGLLRLKPWARTSLIILCSFNVLQQLVGLTLMPLVLSRLSLPDPARALVLLAVIFGVLFAIAIPVTFIVLITRPKVRQAFAEAPCTSSDSERTRS